ncbi:MAG TPA: helix-turn-helix domain-containing protein [Candidatus Deferrimicrobium sp.]|nr:helix-turn-helix domain-containing protein [Candidatus Deferrimicrobium sp.]
MEEHVCPVTDAMEILAKKWTVLIIFKLLDGAKRFSEIENEIAISGRLLSERLKELETNGLVQRHVYPETPVRVEYELTAMGQEAGPIIKEIGKWSTKWIASREYRTVPSDMNKCK